jgi:hypothetical protein
MRRASLALALLLACSAAAARDLAVDVINASTRTTCAEHDNVYIKFRSREVRTFRIEATHPPYLKTLKADSVAPDFKSCDMSRDPVFKFTPRQVVLHDAGNWRLLGFTYESFWRPQEVPVTVGDRTETGLHLLQLWTRGRARNEEVLVLYPADGYWRARVLAPPGLGWKVNALLPTAYGSSFLFGPIEEFVQEPAPAGKSVRPFVDIKAVRFDPEHGIFTLQFARGERGVLRISQIDEERTTIEAGIDAIADRPFAALRSMYVNDDNNDVARVGWKMPGETFGPLPVMQFEQARAIVFTAGRGVPSRHNTSSPDFSFNTFTAPDR